MSRHYIERRGVVIIPNSDIISVSPMRGQVWMVSEPDTVTDALIKAGSRIECKTRPYLVISTDRDLMKGDICINCLPITSNVKNELEFDVFFTNGMGKKNKIKCDQVTTRDSKFFFRHLYDVSADVLVQSIKNVCRRIGVLYPSTDDGISLTQLNERVRQLEDRLLNGVPEVKILEPVIKKPTVVETEIPAGVATKATRKPQRERWTNESARKFVADYNRSKDLKKVQKKYGFTNIKTMYNEKYRLSKRLNEGRL